MLIIFSIVIKLIYITIFKGELFSLASYIQEKYMLWESYLQ